MRDRWDGRRATAKKTAGCFVKKRLEPLEHEDKMFAVIKTGGKQYKVAADDKITIEKLEGEAGAAVSFGEVLMITSDAGSEIGAPTVAGATVSGEIVEQTRSKKTIHFVKRRRQNSKRKKGHRQDLTVVRITSINASGEAPKAAKKAPKAKAAAEEVAASA
jgi:large subunit ribosomal protein L21